jgi:ribosomal protein S18 acetylase RimI-like enzyme
MLDAVTALRPVDVTADVDALYVIARDCEAAVVAEPDSTRADVEGMFTSPEADLVDGSRVAVGDDGAALGFVAVFYDPVGREVTADAYVAPTVDDSVWDVLLDHASAYATSRVSDLPADEAAPWSLCAGSYVQDVRYASALQRQGLAPVRRFHSMGITFDPADPPDPPRTPPPGVTLEVAGDDEALLRVAHGIANTSFKDHWNHVERDYDHDLAWFRSHSFDPTQWLIASADGVPAGVSLGNEHLAELNWGYISTLGVLEEYRGRGIARFLLQTAFAEAYARGRVGVKLGVDSENSTGAPALYNAVGMSPLHEIDFWKRPVLPAAS